MNHPNPVPPIMPAPSKVTDPNEPPLGTDPAEQLPISGYVSAFEAILRQPRRIMFQTRQQASGRLTAALLLITVICSLIYGLVTGSFSGGTQLWAAPVKIAIGLLLSAFICLPSLYIFACLSGAPASLDEVVGLLAGQLALTAVLLIGFAPIVWVFAQSTESVVAMGVLHLVFGLIAFGFGLRFLNRAFEHLNAKSLEGLRLWMLILLTVLLQMTTSLRPIVGTADTLMPTEKKFFLSHWAEFLKQ